MRVFVGQTRAAELVATLRRAGIGECVTRGELPPRRPFWFYDNGAFGDWQAGRDFNVCQFMRDLRRIAHWPMPAPSFLVLPDQVAGGRASLRTSLDWLAVSEQAGAPLYLAVQDGMTPADLVTLDRRIAGIFVGGSTRWKVETAPAWVRWAHGRGLPAHIGRVSTPERLHWARELGADSVDSSFPLWTRDRLAEFIGAATRSKGAEVMRTILGYPWRRLDNGAAGKLGARYGHRDGWVIEHCGHPTALWPYALISPTGELLTNPKNGRAFRTLMDAAQEVARLRVEAIKRGITR